MFYQEVVYVFLKREHQVETSAGFVVFDIGSFVNCNVVIINIRYLYIFVYESVTALLKQ